MRAGFLGLGLVAGQLLVFSALPPLFEGVAGGKDVVSLLLAPTPGGLLAAGLAALLFLRLRLPVVQAEAESAFLASLQERLLEGLLKKPASYWAKESLGELALRLTEDLRRLLSYARALVQSSWLVPLQVVALGGVLYWMAPPVLLAASAVLPFFVLLVLFLGKRLAVVAGEGREAQAAHAGDLTRLLAGAEILQAGDARRQMLLQLGERLRVSFAHGARLSRLSSLGWQLGELLRILGVVVVLVWAQREVRAGTLALSSLLAAAPVAFALYGPLAGLVQLFSELAKGRASAVRVLPLLAESGVPTETAPAVFKERLELREGVFAYGEGPRVLSGASLEIRRGEWAAIVGPSGVGKTTLLRLFLGAETLQGGALLLDGEDVTAHAGEHLRPLCSLVTQTPLFPARTVRENLLLARPDAGDADLWRVLEAAQLAERVKTEEAGLDMDIGEGGAALSGGERERLALARALLSKAPLLFLDEPTAFLDRETSSRVLECLAREQRSRTLLVVTHQEEVLDLVDRAYALKEGRLSLLPGRAKPRARVV